MPEPLGGVSSITGSEGRPHKLEQSKRPDGHRFWHAGLLYVELTVGPYKQVIYVRNRVPIGEDDPVKCFVVSKWLPIATGLRDRVKSVALGLLEARGKTSSNTWLKSALSRRGLSRTGRVQRA